MNAELKKRTAAQNRSIHLYLTHLSNTLNDAGLDMRTFLKESVSIPWTPENAKDHLWRKIQTLMYPGVTSTTDLSTAQVSKVYEVLNRHLAEQGIHVPFPDEFSKFHDIINK